MITVVQKHMEAMGQQLAPGAVVDSSAWTHEGKMLEQRRLRLATDQERESFYRQPAKPMDKKQRK